MTEIKKLVIKGSISTGESQKKESAKKFDEQDIYSILEEFKKEILIDIDNRIVEMIERRSRK